MPPPTHAPWRALALRPAPSPSTTTTTTTTTLLTRAHFFHTTPALTSTAEPPIPPESPKFFSLPTLPQSDETKPPPLKGALPIPRRIFSKRAHGAHKTSPTFVRDTAPLSAAERAGEAPKSDKDAWKRLMASSRRQALADGVRSLHRRKEHRDGRMRARAAANQSRNRAAGLAPERLDDVYTRGTVTQATLETRVVRDPLHAERKAESVRRTAAMHAAKAESRKDAVQRLYVEAASFIVTEEDLAARVEVLFAEDYFRKTALWKGQLGYQNIWKAQGKPMMVRQMLSELKGNTREMQKAFTPDFWKTEQRQKIIAGELTGGALSVLAPTTKKNSTMDEKV